MHFNYNATVVQWGCCSQSEFLHPIRIRAGVLYAIYRIYAFFYRANRDAICFERKFYSFGLLFFSPLARNFFKVPGRFMRGRRAKIMALFPWLKVTAKSISSDGVTTRLLGYCCQLAGPSLVSGFITYVNGSGVLNEDSLMGFSFEIGCNILLLRSCTCNLSEIFLVHVSSFHVTCGSGYQNNFSHIGATHAP